MSGNGAIKNDRIGNWAVSFADSLFIYPGISVPGTKVRTEKI
ncbi:hypothetical protein [Bacillus toyonensis]|nr:hypothetical protein [Bacillus toyonensis]